MGILNDSESGVRFSAIAREMGVEPPFVTELVSKLEKKKLVVIKDSEQDKRAKEVVLTKKGQNRIDALEKALDGELVTFFSSISSGELQTYRQVMKKIEATFEAA
jgi:DNA-binding MarR family transcriptional regulator